MDIRFLLRGLVIGFSIAAPVGPIGVLCIRRTLAEGRASGLVSGLGAATADAVGRLHVHVALEVAVRPAQYEQGAAAVVVDVSIGHG